MRVAMLPHLSHFRTEESGIKRVVEAYFKYLPQFCIELVNPDASYDLLAGHAGMTSDVDVSHVHGLYWTADYPAGQWEWKANKDVIHSIRGAKQVTVPSSWVAETFQRDMRFTPHVVPHGIDWDEWQDSSEIGDYVLWNKNRTGDVCDPTPMMELARKFPKTHFVSTFTTKHNVPSNINVIGVIPHDQMKLLVKSSLVYLATTKETFGIGTLEAMAAGIPVLGFAHGGILDMVQHGVNGYLAKPGDIDDLADGLTYCLKHRDVLGTNGRELAKTFTWEKVAEQVAGIYAQALFEPKPTVAVVIPSYKYGDKVGRAIESAVRQTYRELMDIIVVDDGSDDDGLTRRVVEEWSEKDRRVRYVYQNNAGVANARNRGIQETTAKYICCLDADDALGPKFLETCVPPLEKDRRLGVTYSGLYYYTPSGDEGISPWPTPFDYDAQLQARNQIPTCCVFRREAWRRLGGYRQRYAPGGAGEEDAEFWLRMGAYGWGATMVGDAAEFRQTYLDIKRVMGRPPTVDDIAAHGIRRDYYQGILDSCFHYSWQSGRVSGNKKHAVTDWRGMHPWVKDKQHPFASVATPAHDFSHAVRQYDEPHISVIIPVGPGHENYLINALDSLEAQDFRKWEAIVVWDNPEPVPTFIEDAYPYVRWEITEGGRGAGVARNIGARKARASLLLFLDADDNLRPDALSVMFSELSEQGGDVGVYSDYIGKAIVDNPSGLSTKLQQRIYNYDEKTQEAVIGYQANDFDCERAQRQPEQNPYLWCNITTLFPKAWFIECGGFDEQMPTWEDVDFWWRLAKLGKCFVRVKEELLVYRFYTGGRRDAGVAMHSEILDYLRKKYEGVENMPCGSCGGRRKTIPQPTAPLTSYRTDSSPIAFSAGIRDDDWILCMYTSPNRGDHRVTGNASFENRLAGIPMIHTRMGYHINYNYHQGGEKFLVHRADVRANPTLFVPVPEKAKIPQPVEQPTEPPVPIVDEQSDDYRPGQLEPEPIRPGEKIELKAPDPISTQNPFDLQRLPGIGASIAEELRKRGVESLKDLLDLGEEGLETIPGIGRTRAKLIFEAVKKRNEQGD